jgi:hypothetical protein
MLRDLQFDGYMPGIRVCMSCRDDRHPQEYPIDVTDPEALWKPAPDDAPWDAVIGAVVLGGSVSLSWTIPDPSGAARYENYILSRAYSADGITFGPFALLETFPVTYYGDDLDLADLVENGDPAVGNNGIESQTLAYSDSVGAVGFYQYMLAYKDSNGHGAAAFLTIDVTLTEPLRILEDTVSFRVLEDGVTFRSVEY